MNDEYLKRVLFWLGLIALVTGLPFAIALTLGVSTGWAQTLTRVATVNPAPWGVAVASNGEVYIGDPSNNRVVKLVGGVGSPVVVATGLNQPRGVAVGNNGDVYIADTGNDRAVKLVGGAGSPVVVATGLLFPFGVMVASTGDVYIADYNNNRVVKLVGGAGSLVDVATGLAHPQGVAVASNGDVFIVNDDRMVKLVGGAGSPIEVATGLNRLTSVAVASNGDVYIADFYAGRVVKLVGGAGSPADVATGLNSPTGMAVASSGDVYITDSTGVLKVTVLQPPITLSLSSPLGAPGETVTVPLTLSNPLATSVGGIQLNVALGDTSRAHFVAFSDSLTGLGFDAATSTPGDTTRIVLYSVTNDSIPQGTRTLGTLTYQLSPTVPLGSQNSLTLVIQRVGDPRAQALQATAVSGALLVGIRGDVNLDALIDVLDLIRLARLVIGRDATPSAGSAAFAIGDVNRDAALTVQDIIVQASALLGGL